MPHRHLISTLPYITSISIRIVSAALSLLVTITVARKLELESAGNFFLALSITLFFSIIARFGMDNTMLRLSGAHKSKSFLKAVLGKSVVVIFCFGILYAVTMTILKLTNTYNVFGLNNSTINLVILLAPTVSLLAISTLLSSYYQGRTKTVQAVFILNVYLNAAFLFTILALSISNATILSIAYSAASAIALAISIVVKNDVFPFKLSSRLRYKALITTSSPVWIATIAINLCTLYPQLILSYMHETEFVAYFAVCQRICISMAILVSAVNMVVAPRIAKKYASGEPEKVLGELLYACSLLTALSIPLATGLLYFSDTILGLFGEEYKDAVPMLHILLIGQLFNMISGPVGFVLIMTKNSDALMYVVLTNLACTILHCPLLTLHYGLRGLACSVTLSLILQNCGFLYFVLRQFGNFQVNKPR